MALTLHGGTAAVVKPAKDGSFDAVLTQPGEYSVELRIAQLFSSTRRPCAIVQGDNECNLDLPPTRVDLAVADAGKGLLRAVDIHVKGPVSPTDFKVTGIVTDREAQAFSLAGLEYGVHTIVAFTSDGQTSITPIEVSLTPGRPTTSAVIHLHRRPLQVHVTNPARVPIDTAVVRTQLATVPGNGGIFDAEKTPAGMELMIRATGYLPSCQLAAATPEQVIVLQPLTKSRLRMALIPEQSRPLGAIRGLPGTSCDVDVTMFRLDQSIEQSVGQLRFDILGLPDGTFTYRASPTAEPLDLRVPDGKLNRYAVPPGCMVCG